MDVLQISSTDYEKFKGPFSKVQACTYYCIYCTDSVVFDSLNLQNFNANVTFFHITTISS